MQKETVRIPMNSSLLDLLQSLLSMIMLAAGDIRHGQFLLPLTITYLQHVYLRL